MDSVLELKDISKSFGGISALKNISFELKPGEVHCLIGENGAGKSTIAKIIAGIIKPDAGQIWLNGENITHLDPSMAKSYGIKIVMQELNLMPHLSVAENIFMFDKSSYNHGILQKELINRKTVTLFKELGLSNINPNYLVSKLTIAQKQLVEIVKSLAIKSKILILDEPTSSLLSKEVDHLFEIINRLKNMGTAIILVTHRLKEVFQIGDRATVLRDGQVVKEGLILNYLQEEDLIRLMVGRDIKELYGIKKQLSIGKPILEVKNLSDGKRFYDINFILHSGEILGIAGLMGAGRTEVAECIFGLRKRRSGVVIFNGTQLNNRTPDIIKQGIGLVPEDRKQNGLCIDMSIINNISLAYYGLTKKFLIKQDALNISNITSLLRIKLNNIFDPVGSLSGGNQQKVVIGKWLILKGIQLMIFDEPTRGIDIGAKVEVYNVIKDLANQGKGILIISSEILELKGICDRILVMSNGKITAECSPNASEEEILGYAMQGVKGN
ncbi:sugar ABC transporter ATP-binding protein [Moorella naiadis]|uniref:sugar ABC transporter ATP-binding protein n=1 Tax=Moorella naiadis (nom. illeg.) TaxID=3093670 RepID=UPI003D9CA9F2